MEMQYKKQTDLYSYSNYKLCQRRQNKMNYFDKDDKKGSTVGNDYGYGYATNSANDANKKGL